MSVAEDHSGDVAGLVHCVVCAPVCDRAAVAEVAVGRGDRPSRPLCRPGCRAGRRQQTRSAPGAAGERA